MMKNKKIKITMIDISFKIYLQKNDLNRVKVSFCDVIECSIGVYYFILLKSSIVKLYCILSGILQLAVNM